MTAPTPRQILDTPMQANDAGASTVREYLLSLLALAWQEEEDYNSKRPFGNSSWQTEVQVALASAWPTAGYGTVDSDGRMLDWDIDEVREFNAAMAEAIKALA